MNSLLKTISLSYIELLRRQIQTTSIVTKPPAIAFAVDTNRKQSYYMKSPLTFNKKETTLRTPCSCNDEDNKNTRAPKQHDASEEIRTVFSYVHDSTEQEIRNIKNNTKSEPTTNKETWLRTILNNTQHENTILREIDLKTQFVSDIPYKYRADIALDPTKCVGVDTEMGRDLLASTLHGDIHGRIFFTLWQQFLTQSDSLLCGPSSMVMVLNALKVSVIFSDK